MEPKATFKFKDNSITLKIAVAKPSKLSQIWKLSSFSLIDDDGEEYKIVNDSFDPPLTENKNYSILINETTPEFITSAPTLNPVQTAMPMITEFNNPQRTVAATQEDFLRSVVISHNEFVSDNAGMLFNAACAPFIIDTVSTLSNIAPDPSLVSKNMEREQFKYLKTPTSLKSCIFQLSDDARKAYLSGHDSMLHISEIKDVPELIKQIFEIRNQPEVNKELLEIVLKSIFDIVKGCEERASKTQQQFQNVMDTVTELVRATIVSQKTYNDEYTQTSIHQQQLKMAVEECEARKIKLQKDNDEAKKLKAEATEQLTKQCQSNDAMQNMLIMSLAETVPHVLGSVIPSSRFATVSSLIQNTGNAVASVASANSSAPHLLINNPIEMALSQTLLKISAEIMNLRDEEKIKKHIASLEHYTTVTFQTTEGLTLFSSAVKCLEFLKTNMKKLADRNEENDMKEEIESMKSSLEKDVNTFTAASNERQKQQNSQNEARGRISEQIIKADMEKTKAVSNLYTKESENAERISNEVNKNAEELMKTVLELTRTDFTKIDLEGYINHLENVLAYVGKTQENWANLVEFFQSILNFITSTLNVNVSNFTSYAQLNSNDILTRKLLHTSALKTVARCIQISHCAEIYCEIYTEIMRPTINGITTTLSLTEEVANQKIGNLDNELENVKEKTCAIIEKKKTVCFTGIESQMQDLATYFDTL